MLRVLLRVADPFTSTASLRHFSVPVPCTSRYHLIDVRTSIPPLRRVSPTFSVLRRCVTAAMRWHNTITWIYLVRSTRGYLRTPTDAAALLQIYTILARVCFFLCSAATSPAYPPVADTCRLHS